MSHASVLLHEVLTALVPPGKTIHRAIDGTLGAGGHSLALLQAGVQRLLAFDLDPQAIRLAEQRLCDYTGRVTIVQDSYATMAQHAQALGWPSVDAIVLDLGLSSMQLDTPERGFAFRHDGPLDMRFNPDSAQATAADIVNQWGERELAAIFWKYGEERYSRRIAQAIVRERPLHTTGQLADLVQNSVPKSKTSKIHPATRVFQALRIAVNDELRTVEQALHSGIALLAPGGRFAVISFHSLEDRIVKQVFKEASTEIIAPPGMASVEEKQAQVRLVNRKPIVPDDDEIAANPRSRSSKLRVVEKCEA